MNMKFCSTLPTTWGWNFDIFKRKESLEVKNFGGKYLSTLRSESGQNF
jgi:hypothetical protein